MTVWKKAMSYLGLGPDDAYDDYDLPPEPERAAAQPVSLLGGLPAGSGARRAGRAPPASAPTGTTDALPRRARRPASPRARAARARPFVP